jgi:acyl carrier protein
MSTVPNAEGPTNDGATHATSPTHHHDHDPRSEAAVLATVASLVRQVIGEEWADDTPITMKTSFAGDLELESIEFVALAERLKETYGAEVDFPRWLASMNLKQIIGLEVGALVEYIVRCLSKPTTA